MIINKIGESGIDIYEFEKENNITFVINEYRGNRSIRKFMARLYDVLWYKDLETSSVMETAIGDGVTPREALIDLLSQIEGKVGIVCEKPRQYIHIPKIKVDINEIRIN